MSDFKFSDMGFTEGESSKKRDSKKLKWLIIAIIAIILFIIVLFIGISLVNSLSKKEKTERVQETERLMSATDANVVNAYKYLNFNYQGERYNRFYSSKKTNTNSFTNYEKIFIGLSQIKETDVSLSGTNEQGQIVYLLDRKILDTYISNFFGEDNKVDDYYYQDLSKVKSNYLYTFNFSTSNNLNTGRLIYDSANDKIEIIFEKNVDNTEKLTDLGTSKVLSKIESAKVINKGTNQTLEITERIVFLDTEKEKNENGVETGTYILNVYKDGFLSQKIGYLKGKTLANFKKDTFTIDQFISSNDESKNVANYMIYKFKYSGGKYYFTSSELLY